MGSPGWPSAVMPCSRPAVSAKCTLPSPLTYKSAFFFFFFPFIPCSVPKGQSGSRCFRLLPDFPQTHTSPSRRQGVSLTPFKTEIYCPPAGPQMPPTQMCRAHCAPCLTQTWLAEAALHRFHLLHSEACPQEGGKVSPWTKESSAYPTHFSCPQDSSSDVLVLMKNKTNKLNPQ